MKILDRLVQVNAHTRTKEYYQRLGYIEQDGFFYINPNDLLEHSSAQETRICDCCGKEFTRRHEYHEVTFKRFGKDLCGDCVKNNQEIKNIIQNKKEQTWNDIYGSHPMQTEEIKNKVIDSWEEKYGGHPMHNKDIKDKWVTITNEKFGGNSPMCDEKIRIKSNQTLCSEGLIPISSQQRKIFEMLSDYYECYLNFPEGVFTLDIMVNNNNQKIDVEYDGEYWHQDIQKDRRRDEVLKSRGYKILRIKAKHKIPTFEQIQEGIEYLNNHSYSQIDVE